MARPPLWVLGSTSPIATSANSVRGVSCSSEADFAASFRRAFESAVLPLAEGAGPPLRGALRLAARIRGCGHFFSRRGVVVALGKARSPAVRGSRVSVEVLLVAMRATEMHLKCQPSNGGRCFPVNQYRKTLYGFLLGAYGGMPNLGWLLLGSARW